MKESIGSTWLFGIVITFIVLFASIVSMSVNWSRAYKVKDEIIFNIENTHGFNADTMTTINEYMRRVGYRSVGDCPEKYCGFSINSDISNKWNNGSNFCVKRVDVETGPGDIASSYYSVVVFFKLDMPVLGNILKLDVSGETAKITKPRDFDDFSC